MWESFRKELKLIRYLLHTHTHTVIDTHTHIYKHLNPHIRAHNELCTLKYYNIDRYPKLGLIWIDMFIKKMNNNLEVIPPDCM